MREESGDMMFSLTSSLIRPVSLPNTTRQLDLTVLQLPQSHQDYTFKRSNKHEEGKTPESQHNFRKTDPLIAEKQKSQNYKEHLNLGVPSCMARCFAGTRSRLCGVRTSTLQIPRGRLWKSRMIQSSPLA